MECQKQEYFEKLRSYKYEEEEKYQEKWVDNKTIIFREVLVLVLNIFITSLYYSHMTHNTYIKLI